ncbi:hypothetical protein B0H14DRAFT_2599300 [Mycena olivaceomarginata]|nr:hypothetical protein B0H14DRAFT_2599300 [Mycena olivaceomarginata]
MGISVDDGREPANSRSEDPVGRAKSSKFCGENGLKVCKPWKGKNSTSTPYYPEDRTYGRVSGELASMFNTADLGHFFTSIARDEHPLSIQILKFLAVNGVAFPVVPRANLRPLFHV